MKVTFDGVNKLIKVNQGEEFIDIQLDIYTEWVRWSELNTEYLYAMRYTGGDPTFGGQFSGLIFFLINDWRIFFENSVTFAGSVFSDDYNTPFITPNGTYMGQSIASSLVTQIPGTAISPTDIDSIRTGIWSDNLSTYPLNTAGAKVNILDMMKLLVDELHKINGLDSNNNVEVTKDGRTVDSISQTFDVNPTTGDVIITRN